MKPSRINIAACILLAMGIVLTMSCGKRDAAKNAPPLKSVTIATFSKALGNSPYYIAKHFGWFAAKQGGIKVPFDFKEYNDRPSISDAFASGSLQVLFCADVPAILCRAQGNDIRIATLSATVNQNILVQKDSSIHSVGDLKGKKLAILQGTSSHFCLLKILRMNGMSDKDLDLRYMPAAEAKTAFENGTVDAWAVWAPFVEQQEVSGKGRLVSGGDAVINSVMSIDASFLRDYPDVAKAIIDAVQKAKDWIANNPEEAQAIASKELNLDAAVVRLAWPKHNWQAQLDEKAIEDIQAKATFMADEDKTRNSKHLNVRTELVLHK